VFLVFFPIFFVSIHLGRGSRHECVTAAWGHLPLAGGHRVEAVNAAAHVRAHRAAPPSLCPFLSNLIYFFFSVNYFVEFNLFYIITLKKN
jgi:hypothetical protein